MIIDIKLVCGVCRRPVTDREKKLAAEHGDFVFIGYCRAVEDLASIPDHILVVPLTNGPEEVRLLSDAALAAGTGSGSFD